MTVVMPTTKPKDMCKGLASRDFVLREAELQDAHEIHEVRARGSFHICFQNH